MAIVSFVVFAAISLAGFFLLTLGLPGIWLLLAGILASIALHPSVAITFGMVAALAGLAALAELLEFACNYFGAKRFGTSTAAIWGGIAGGLAGALVLGALIPIVGAVPGAFAGTFIGAYAVEWARGSSRERALSQGYGALAGRTLALVVKLGMAMGMAGLGLTWLLGRAA